MNIEADVTELPGIGDVVDVPEIEPCTVELHRGELPSRGRARFDVDVREVATA